MTTTETVPIAITCPDWCEVEPEEHAADLWELGGNVIHRSGGVWVNDPTDTANRSRSRGCTSASPSRLRR